MKHTTHGLCSTSHGHMPQKPNVTVPQTYNHLCYFEQLRKGFKLMLPGWHFEPIKYRVQRLHKANHKAISKNQFE